jgi:hypothetical protein
MSKVYPIILVPPMWSGEYYRDNRNGILYRTLGFLGYPGYCVGTDGRVWSRLVLRGLGSRRGTTSYLGRRWRRLRPVRGRNGYLLVTLCTGRARRNFFIHRLVLLAFVGPCPPGIQCRHLNGSPADNRVENLAWGTAKEDADDKRRHGTLTVGARNGSRRHPDRLARGDRHGSRTHPENVLRGEQHPQARLTAGQVRNLRRLYATGKYSYTGLARLVGVSAVAIGQIVRGETWVHV